MWELLDESVKGRVRELVRAGDVPSVMSTGLVGNAVPKPDIPAIIREMDSPALFGPMDAIRACAAIGDKLTEKEVTALIAVFSRLRLHPLCDLFARYFDRFSAYSGECYWDMVLGFLESDKDDKWLPELLRTVNVRRCRPRHVEQLLAFVRDQGMYVHDRIYAKLKECVGIGLLREASS
jgi:hypothetical protein